jgi:hypothetical protein
MIVDPPFKVTEIHKDLYGLIPHSSTPGMEACLLPVRMHLL